MKPIEFWEKFGKFNNMHREWHEMFLCHSRFGFCPSWEIEVNETIPFPQILFAGGAKYDNAKARFFAEMTERYGCEKMVEWVETIDLLYYYEAVFCENYETFIEEHDVSFYEDVLRGEIEASEVDESIALALWIDGRFRAESKLEVFYCANGLIKAAIKFRGAVLGIVNILGDSVVSYVADYTAWERRRAYGYTRNNPYAETDFMQKILAYSVEKSPRILEIGIGGGRKAKPFVKAGFEYYGIDISEGMLEECSTMLETHENLHVQVHNVYDGLPFENEFFDIVIECRAISNMINDTFIMSEIERVMKPCGVLFCDIGDNNFIWEECSEIFIEQWDYIHDKFKIKYLEKYNITDKIVRGQKMYGLGLPKKSAVALREADYVVPKTFEVFTKQQPFSVCEYEFDFIQYALDNMHHMAYFRTEPMYEPCGTEFFKEMAEAVKERFGEMRGMVKRFTELKVYKYTAN